MELGPGGCEAREGAREHHSLSRKIERDEIWFEERAADEPVVDDLWNIVPEPGATDLGRAGRMNRDAQKTSALRARRG